MQSAIGTDDIQVYFPYLNVKGQGEPHLRPAQHPPKETAGKIRLGLDLQGGTEIVVSLGTNRIVSTDTNLGAVSGAEAKKSQVGKAVEILRKRVDALGVAEPGLAP